MSKRFRTLPSWVVFAIAVSGLFILLALLLHRGNPTAFSHVNPSTVELDQSKASQAVSTTELGPRHQLTYEQWVSVLRQEAKVAAEQKSERLMILAGDSLSLWFPLHLLPPDVTWLNQGISGETSYGLMHRLELFDQTRPEVIFVMIGINDLIREVRHETLLANQQEIIRHLKKAHPNAKIIVQSILPHGIRHIDRHYRNTTFRNRKLPFWVDRLAAVSNQEIRMLNQQLAAVAQAEKVEYLDLFPLFVDAEGELAPKLSTDGLHLSDQGYQVWRSQLEKFSRPPRKAEVSIEPR